MNPRSHRLTYAVVILEVPFRPRCRMVRQQLDVLPVEVARWGRFRPRAAPRLPAMPGDTVDHRMQPSQRATILVIRPATAPRKRGYPQTSRLNAWRRAQKWTDESVTFFAKARRKPAAAAARHEQDGRWERAFPVPTRDVGARSRPNK